MMVISHYSTEVRVLLYESSVNIIYLLPTCHSFIPTKIINDTITELLPKT